MLFELGIIAAKVVRYVIFEFITQSNRVSTYEISNMTLIGKLLLGP